MGQGALRSVRTRQEVRSKHQEDLAIDRLTAVPTEVYTEFLAAGKAARRRGQHRQCKNKEGVSMLRCSESARELGGVNAAIGHGGQQ